MKIRDLFIKPARAIWTIFDGPPPPKPRTRVRTKVQLVNRDIMRATIDDWRTSAELVSAAREVLRNPVLRQMLDVIRNSSPGLGVLPDNAVPELRQHWQSKAEGYIAALSALESLGVEVVEPEQLQATFEPEETSVNQ